MLKIAVLICVACIGYAMADEARPVVTKEQHMAAEASCKATHDNIRGKELKDCIKARLGL